MRAGDEGKDRMAKKPKIALVLGAGSARGLAHIGVLQVLEENQIPFDMIVGSSMGAMVGGIYASGVDLYMLDKMVEHMNTRMLVDLVVPNLGFIAGKRISEFLDLLTKKKDFSDLNRQLIVVATDLMSGERAILEEGSVTEAIRASISLPGIFTPVNKDGRFLVDGAVIDRLPVQVAQARGSDLVIAVDVTFGPGKKIVINTAMDVILTSLEIMGKHHFDTVLPHADILIQPEVSHINPKEFDRSREIVDLGRRAMEDKLGELKSRLKQLTSKKSP